MQLRASALREDLAHMNVRLIALGALFTTLLVGLELRGDPQAPRRRLVVRVGEVAEADVGYKIGYACDDATILRAWVVTRGEHNWFVVQGVAAGMTWCRVGINPLLPSYLFQVIVEPARPSTEHAARTMHSRPA
jgi:hypothetical protein